MDWLARQARERPDAPALLAGTDRMAYRELAAAAARGARHLDALGIGPGTTLLWEARSTLPALCGLHAALWAGATIVPFRPGIGRETRRDLAARTRATALLSAGGEPPGSSGIAFDELPTDGPERPAAAADPERVLTVLQTSGSGGPAKLVPLRLRQHAASIEAISRRLDLSADDRWLACLPLHHIGGLAIVLRALFTGASVSLHERFEAEDVVDELNVGRITHASLVPTLLGRLVGALDGPLAGSLSGRLTGSLRCVLIGGAASEPELLSRARAMGLPVVPTWGMTEAASQLATPSPTEAAAIDFAAAPGRIGRVLDGVELRSSSGAGREDQLEVRAPQLFDGYADSPGGPDADGWFATGDRGVIDADGRLWITGRVSDRIISGGENVDPLAVERALREAGMVDEAGVIGLPDAEWGERVAAVVVSGHDAEALSRWAREHLEPQERPRQWRIVDDLPRTELGKPDRAALMQMFDG